MPAEVETLMYVSNEENERFVPWHGLGTAVATAPTSGEAIKLSGLDWQVQQTPVFTNGNEIPNYKANVRNTDGKVLGIVTNRYRIVQNSEAFDFTDSLVGNNDVRYETAGSLRDGKTVWLLARLPKRKVLADEFDPYICFTNSHDGMGAIRVCCTPIRVVCNNTLNLALRQAKRSWAIKHTGNIQEKLREAETTLGLTDTYMAELNTQADVLAHSKISNDEILKVLDELFPVSADASDRQKQNVKEVKEEILCCCLAPDILQYVNTKYGFINAISDWCGHATPKRNTEEYRDNNWGRIMNGHPVLDRAYELVNAL